ncbi:MAG: DUF2442 domain-containing protein [Nitrococcus sp.]|nr:DUF2442 domain-containing protein [Nitrococcus sp.]
MDLNERELAQAEKRMATTRAAYAVTAWYDRRTSRVVVRLNTGLELAIPPKLSEGLADAKPAELANIEISPAGLGLHWPKLDVDLYLPALLQGVLGSESWMAKRLGSVGGRARSAAKAAASRENGRKGGRPRMDTAGR